MKAERAYWAQFAPLLASARILTPSDVETLGDYCRACEALNATMRRLRAAWNKRHPDFSTVRLLDAQARGWIEKKLKLAGDLGLTAISRTRLNWTGHQQTPKADTPQPAKSKLAELQERAASLRRPVGVR